MAKAKNLVVSVKKKAQKRPRKSKKKPPPKLALIQCWSTDPMGGMPPLQIRAPELPGATLPTRIVDQVSAPAPQVYTVGTSGFRFWTAVESLRRSAELWSFAGTRAWNPAIGGQLPVRLNDGVDLNAYYARHDSAVWGTKKGLSFFHDMVRDVLTGQHVTVFSGESPDVIAHELGHAVLDALKPELWHISTTEAAAFHESFGDMSAILAALQLPAVRQAVLEETDGRLSRNSSVSRVAEQLGYAIRQRSPSAVDSDSLRNAANSFIYSDPTLLPAHGPASILTRAPHNFSRVFTGAFLDALGGMSRALMNPPDADAILQASRDMAVLLARAVANAATRTRFFQSVAEQLVLADQALFSGRYAEPLTAAFVRRGVLPIRAVAAPGEPAPTTVAEAAAAAARSAAVAATGAAMGLSAAEAPVMVALNGPSFGLPAGTFYAEAPAVDDAPPRMMSLGITGEAPAPGRSLAVQVFVEDLILRGRLRVGSQLARGAMLINALARTRVTHHLARVDSRVELQRLTFECGH